MDTENSENMELYTDWLGIEVLLDCMEREFFKENDAISAESVEQLRQRAAEMGTYIKHCKEAGLMRLEDIDKGGGYAAILRGLALIEKQAEKDGGGMAVKDWRELEYTSIKIKIHAWAQRMRARGRLLEEARRGVIV